MTSLPSRLLPGDATSPGSTADATSPGGSADLASPGTADLTSPGGSADLTLVREEVLAVFLRYEQALAHNDVATMNGLFWDDPRVVRFGVADAQWGGEAVAAWRASAAPVPPDRRLSCTDVLVLGPDAAVVTTLFGYGGADATGRQTQVWSRTSAGWRVVSAHVSDLGL